MVAFSDRIRFDGRADPRRRPFRDLHYATPDAGDRAPKAETLRRRATAAIPHGAPPIVVRFGTSVQEIVESRNSAGGAGRNAWSAIWGPGLQEPVGPTAAIARGFIRNVYPRRGRRAVERQRSTFPGTPQTP